MCPELDYHPILMFWKTLPFIAFFVSLFLTHIFTDHLNILIHATKFFFPKSPRALLQHQQHGNQNGIKQTKKQTQLNNCSRLKAIYTKMIVILLEIVGLIRISVDNARAMCCSDIRAIVSVLHEKSINFLSANFDTLWYYVT